jgi:hypothetical protein
MTHYMVADIYALCSRNHSQDSKQAFGHLAAALRGGFGFEYVDTDADLEPIRARPEFKQLVASARLMRAAALQVGAH